MANYFEFNVAKAPDLSTSATLLRNAGQSVQDAANAFNAGSKLIRDANVEKDTRVRENNTNYWVNRIRQAESPEDVDLLRNEINSEDFQNQYEKDLYIDSGKLLSTLEGQPKAIKDRAEIENSLTSISQDPAVAALQTAISKSTNENQIAAVLADAEKKGLTTANTSLLLSTASTRRRTLSTNKANDASARYNNYKLQKEQQQEAYNKDSALAMSNGIQSLISSGATPEEVATWRDNKANELAQKYGISVAKVTADLAPAGAQFANIMGRDIKLGYDSLSDDNQTAFVASKVIVGKDTEALAKEQMGIELGRMFPSVHEALTDELVSSEDETKLLQTLRTAGIDTTEYSKLPRELRTRKVITDLSTAERTSDFDKLVLDLSSQYSDYLSTSSSMSSLTAPYVATVKQQKERLGETLDKTVIATAKVQKDIEERQNKGLPIDNALKALSKLNNDFTTTTKRIQRIESDALKVNPARVAIYEPKGVEMQLTSAKATATTDRGTLDSQDRLLLAYGVSEQELINANEPPVIDIGGGFTKLMPTRIFKHLKAQQKKVEEIRVKGIRKSRKELEKERRAGKSTKSVTYTYGMQASPPPLPESFYNNK